VSIFAVVFSALLLTILTVGFIRLIVSAQQRAINNDLSQSAYDAALAGVEDAKRAVRSCLRGNAAVCAELDAPADCRVVARTGVEGSEGDPETMIQSGGGSESAAFDQAYTCVNIAMQSPDFRTELAVEGVGIIPLRAADSFDTIVIEWFVPDDAPQGTLLATVSTQDDDRLPQVEAWGQATPPLMRAQLITPGSSFTADELDDSDASRTVFLRPLSMTEGATGLNSTVVVPLGDYNRATDGEARTNRPRTLTCSSTFQNNGHSCLARLQIGSTVSPAESATALLRLNTVYNKATVRVTLYNGSDLVYFDGVQPVVDSTGRANNLFRRVEARLAIGDDVPLPSRVVDVVNNLCKDFSVGSSGAQAGSC
ncbi:hypothetical protein B7Z17_04540, partial [Candidatus Saccharibacteria bacterium 32-49-10]